MIFLKVFLPLLLIHQNLALVTNDDIYSEFWDLNNVPTETVKLRRKSFIYVGSAYQKNEKSHEDIINISTNNTRITIAAAARKEKDGFLQPAFDEAVDEFQILTVPGNKYENPAIIYVVEENAKNPVMTSNQGIHKHIVLNGTRINEYFITVLSPEKRIFLSNITGTSMLSWITLSAGGAAQAKMEEYQLLDLGKLIDHSKSGLLILEPIVTIRQSAQLTGTINIDVESKTIDIERDDEGNEFYKIELDWGESAVAMTSGYRFPNMVNDSVRYTFVAKQNNSRFNVVFSGDIPANTSITFKNYGFDGIGIRGFAERSNIKREFYSFLGNKLDLHYQHDPRYHIESAGFFARVEVQKSSRMLMSLFMPIVVLFFNYF